MGREVNSPRDKLGEEHVEQVRDTVRHTEVDVEDGTGDRSAFSFGSGEDRTTASDSEKSDFERDRSR